MVLGNTLHFLAIIISTAISSFGVIVGQSIATFGVNEALARQPGAKNKIIKLLFYGLFLIESSFILSFIFALMMLSKSSSVISFNFGLTEFGIGLNMAIGSSLVAITIGKVIATACVLVAKQPDQEQKIQFILMILLTLIETPVFFIFTIGLFIFNKLTPGLNVNDAYRFFSAILAIGMGSVGPTIAQYIFAPAALKAALFIPKNSNDLFNYMIITEALIETSALFSFIISLLMIIKKINPLFEGSFVGFIFLTIALTISFGGMASAFNIGKIGRDTIELLAHNFDKFKQENISGLVFKTSFAIQFFIETCGLLAFIVSLFLVGKLLF